MTDQFDAQREIKRIVEESLGADRVFSTIITSHLDHADEPAYSIGVTMKFERDIPDAREQTRLTHELRQTLTRLGDERFPYLYFYALDIDRSDEQADDADPWPVD